MKTAGIIAEYNPITNGHVYHLEKTREMSRADFVVVVMSGDFTQRGRPAIMDKWKRSALAVECGADLVLEMPFVYATGSAEMFARGGVGILEGLGVVDTLSFGSESGEICKLVRVADLLKYEPPQFKEMLKQHLQTGMSFPKARQLAVSEALCASSQEDAAEEIVKSRFAAGKTVGMSSQEDAAEEIVKTQLAAGKTVGQELAKLLESPNNILAIEYLKQIRTMQAVSVKRLGGYSDVTIPEKDGMFASAGAVRAALGEGRFEEAAAAVPEKCFDALKKTFCDNSYIECAEKRIASRINTDNVILKTCDSKEKYFDLLRTVILRSSAEDLRKISGVTEGIENRIKREIRNHSSYDSYADAVKSRRFTRTAIDRMMLHILTGLSSADCSVCGSPSSADCSVCGSPSSADCSVCGSPSSADCSVCGSPGSWDAGIRYDALYARTLAFNDNGAQLIKRAKSVSKIPLITNINKEMPDDRLLRRLIEYDILASDIYNVLMGADLYKNSDYVIGPSYIR